jgi:hypothetical protein
MAKCKQKNLLLHVHHDNKRAHNTLNTSIDSQFPQNTGKRADSNLTPIPTPQSPPLVAFPKEGRGVLCVHAYSAKYELSVCT